MRLCHQHNEQGKYGMTQATKGHTEGQDTLMKQKGNGVYTSAKVRLTQEIEVLNLFLYGNLKDVGVGVVALRGSRNKMDAGGHKKVQLILSGVDICVRCGTIYPPKLVSLEGICDKCNSVVEVKK